MIRRRIAAILTASVAFVVAGCSGIPTSGSVHEGGAVSVADAGEIQFLPAGPREGATPSDILNGFLEASSSPQNDFAIAREFLTVDANGTWDPSALTLIDSGARSVASSSDTLEVVSIQAEAVLDATGRYSTQPQSAHFDLSFGFEQRNGQWRISSLPQGIVIDSATFFQVFRQTSLYFLTSDLARLVPDVRWFPARAATTTRVTKALLAGPASWLAEGGAVVSAFPSGTSLVADTVPVRSGVAYVDLAGEGLVEKPQRQRLMQAQLYASLTQVGGVSGIDMRVLGAPAPQVDVASVVAELSPSIDARAVVMRGDAFGYASVVGVTKVGVLPTTVSATNATAATVSPGLDRVAVLAEGGVSVFGSKGAGRIVDSRVGLIAPAVDAQGFTWTVATDSPGDIHLTASDGSESRVTPPWQGADRIVTLRVSGDGSRVLALVVDAGKTHLYVASVSRSDSGVPQSIGSTLDLDAPGGNPVDAVWLDTISVASVGVDASGVGTVVTQVVGGRTTTYATVTNPVALSGGSSASSLRALLADGRVVANRSGVAWSVEFTDVTALAVVQ